ncbi:MAG: hypothetical protein IV086_05720 [Hyphomonadaceae bacterium]|nr:MAG: hypothetical protein FD160_163 [Caulobacteraceae bacterium]MBT9445177.1 hypothetical protein [Hyphomonadaceae bacterium]TPW07715.1 MAG: hypothetical protein FD124_940 [Alphaproteobacteria bacterium]
MRRLVFVLAAVAAAISPALAQSGQTGAYLSAPEARRIFYGIDMQGEHQPSGDDWRECIDPDGKTAYWFNGAYDEGRLVIRRDGALCFSYASRGYRNEACWMAKRVSATNYRFESVDGDDGVFVTTRTRSAQTCPARDAPTS